ncbi:hypothetical protein INT45_000775 [Circinella minor]|uniref:Uncharacterized protein n=1 Tax=Circinella minor TaxID=1195481 RepID=A0A8H7RYN8_9FUNG|nr:hypothetical protein INT45_000775 [Circinella minor]
MVTEACQELQAFLGISNETGQTVYDLLHFYLSPTQPISEDPSCEVIGGEASLSISIGQIQNEEVARETEPLIFRYSNGCVMKTIAKQAGLSHFLPFYETGILPVPPVVE